MSRTIVVRFLSTVVSMYCACSPSLVMGNAYHTFSPQNADEDQTAVFWKTKDVKFRGDVNIPELDPLKKLRDLALTTLNANDRAQLKRIQEKTEILEESWKKERSESMSASVDEIRLYKEEKAVLFEAQNRVFREALNRAGFEIVSEVLWREDFEYHVIVKKEGENMQLALNYAEARFNLLNKESAYLGLGRIFHERSISHEFDGETVKTRFLIAPNLDTTKSFFRAEGSLKMRRIVSDKDLFK